MFIEIILWDIKKLIQYHWNNFSGSKLSLIGYYFETYWLDSVIIINIRKRGSTPLTHKHYGDYNRKLQSLLYGIYYSWIIYIIILLIYKLIELICMQYISLITMYDFYNF
jgi:hypothetical protein